MRRPASLAGEPVSARLEAGLAVDGASTGGEDGASSNWIKPVRLTKGKRWQ